MAFVMNEPISFAGGVLKTFNEAVLAVDVEGVLRYVSPPAALLLGREIDDLLGRQVEGVLKSPAGGLDAIHTPHGHPIRECIRDAVVRKNQHGGIEAGKYKGRSVNYDAAPLTLDGTVVGAMAVLNSSGLSERLVNAQKLEGLGRIAAGVAHEINTPTQYVNDNVHFLQDAFIALADLIRASERVVECARQGTPVDAAIAELAKASEKAGLDDLEQEIPAALEQTLDGLSRITRIAGALREFLHPARDEKTAADLHRIIENAVAVCRNEWRYVAEVDLDFDTGLPSVVCWINDLSQVVLNLVTNAAHSIADKLAGAPEELGRIKISTRRCGECAEIRVSDTGTGIPEHLVHAIFDPFFTTKEAGKGTGQGLGLARSVVVDQHGGSIDVESQVGQGATFIIIIPFRENQNRKIVECEAEIRGGLTR